MATNTEPPPAGYYDYLIDTGELSVNATVKPPKPWKLSTKGNIWRTMHGVTVSVYMLDTGGYRYCIADGGGPKFSQREYPTRRDAMRAVEALVEEVYGAP